MCIICNVLVFYSSEKLILHAPPWWIYEFALISQTNAVVRDRSFSTINRWRHFSECKEGGLARIFSSNITSKLECWWILSFVINLINGLNKHQKIFVTPKQKIIFIPKLCFLVRTVLQLILVFFTVFNVSRCFLKILEKRFLFHCSLN